MKNFLGYNTDDLDINYNNTIIDLNKPPDLDVWVNTLYYCYKKSISCNIGNHISSNFKGITFSYNNKITQINWIYLIKINKFINKKFKLKKEYNLSKSGFYHIFFIEFIKTNKQFISNSKSYNELIGNNNNFFGIYDSYQEQIYNCEHSLYYSYGLNRFLLYRVESKDNFIYGKLCPQITITNNKIMINTIEYNIPDAFINIKNNIYGLRRRDITIKLLDTDKLSCRRENKNFANFCDNYRNENIYYLELPNHLNKSILEKLYKFLVLRFPILENTSNNIFVEPSTISNYKSYFSMYIMTKSIQYLVIHFNQILFQYIDHIISSIEEFFIKIKTNPVITTKQYQLEYNKGDRFIHLFSEIYYLIVIILLKVPYIVKNLNFIDNPDDEYTQINYKFTKDEIKKLNSNSDDYNDYLLKIVINSISIFMDNYYVFIHQNSDIDILPIMSGMNNKTIDGYLSRSRKATYSKGFLISYLSNFFINMNNKNMEIPVIFLNIMKLNKSSFIKINKIHGINLNKNIPMIFNIVYSEDSLLITVSYKPKYKKIKYFFSEIITQILEES